MSLIEKSIDKTIPVPLYYQLKQHLKEHINHCKVGDAIPTETELCEHFDVSRPTVRQAIAELVTEGHLTRSKGKGTFVTKPKVQRDFVFAMRSFNREMREHGKTPATRVLNLEMSSASTTVAAQLKINTGDQIIFLRRLRFADGLPLMLVNTFLPAGLLPGFLELDLEKNALHETLKETYRIDLIRGIRAVEAIAAPEEEARLLEINAGAPVQYMESTFFTEDETPVEFSMAWYRGDHSRFVIELHPAIHWSRL